MPDDSEVVSCKTRLIVDVSHVDWSNHPAWSRDFDASTMLCNNNVPEWAGEVIAKVHQLQLRSGKFEVYREPVSEGCESL